jgi:hypothetical protein
MVTSLETIDVGSCEYTQTGALTSVFLLSSCVVLAQSLNSSKLQFFHGQNGAKTAHIT